MNFGREKKRADIVIFEKNRLDTPYIVVEVKKPKLQDGKEQPPLLLQCHRRTPSLYGQTDSRYHTTTVKIRITLKILPIFRTLTKPSPTYLNERFTLKDLILKDKLAAERKSLKDIILELEDEVLANAGVDVFEEVFKLIFTKLYDEFKSQDDKTVINHFLQQKASTRLIIWIMRCSRKPLKT